MPHVFDRFHQADPLNSHRGGGLGLGLALAKHLTELHGGTIEAASKGIGLGSTFTIRLPLLAQSRFFKMKLPALHIEGAIELPDTATIEGVRVLAVDDQQEAREVLATFLSQCGAVVTAVSSGDEALSILAAQTDSQWPHVFIYDIAMPGEDGYAVMKRVRTLEAEQRIKESQRLPAIALTAMASRREDWVRALTAGFNMHVAKPVEPAELVMMIASLVEERRIGQAAL